MIWLLQKPVRWITATLGQMPRCRLVAVGTNLASPATRETGHCRQGTGADMITAVIDGGS